MARSRRKRLRREQAIWLWGNGEARVGPRVDGRACCSANVQRPGQQDASHFGHRHLWRGINGKLTAQAFAP